MFDARQEVVRYQSVGVREGVEISRKSWLEVTVDFPRKDGRDESLFIGVAV